MIRVALTASVALIASTALSSPVLAAEAAPAKKVLAYALANWDTAIYETKYMDECPEGPVIGNDTYWWRGMSKAERDEKTEKGIVQPVDRRFASVYRGPKGEDVCWNPEIITEPPHRMVKGKTSYGFNLDGESDGKATAKSCAHENFTGHTGTPGVDNQLYRLLGCAYGWRRNGVLDLFGNEERRNSGRGVILVEVGDVDDEKNDDHVEVAFYRAIDSFAIDSSGRILPWASYRIDTNQGKPRYGTVAKGKIKNGVLMTTAIDAKLPYYGNSAYAEIDLKDMMLELNLALDAESKVKGFIGGYYDFDKWWEYMLKLEFLIATGDWSCPALYAAAKQAADGYPDATGQCTAISSAFEIDAVPAFIVHETETAAR